MLADHDFDIDSEIIFVAEDFDNAAAGILVSGGPVCNLDIDYSMMKVMRAPSVRDLAGELMREHSDRAFTEVADVSLSVSIPSTNGAPRGLSPRERQEARTLTGWLTRRLRQR